jgi:hypothetical protein
VRSVGAPLSGRRQTDMFAILKHYIAVMVAYEHLLNQASAMGKTVPSLEVLIEESRRSYPDRDIFTVIKQHGRGLVC